MQAWADGVRTRGETIGFVPTMGFLHEGHLSLIRAARENADRTVLSIFVNPTQFAPGEDFEEYPRDMQRDLQLAEAHGTDVVFSPEVSELYPDGYETYVLLESLPMHLCGLSRPVFFRGVATIVAKLFHIIKPHVAVFGRKDYQQLQVIRKLVRDLDFGIEIIGGPIVREPDGIAMSSRNAYLKKSQRPSALTLIESLENAHQQVKQGEHNAARIREAARAHILSRPDTQIDYVRICDPETLVDVDTIDKPVLMALAVKVGKTRLIDNMILEP